MKPFHIPVFIVIYVTTASCELYHPDLISRKESENRISKACLSSLFRLYHKPVESEMIAAGDSDFEKNAADSAAYLCNYDHHIYANKDEMVRTSDTDYCVKAMLSMPGPEYSDMIAQYAMIRNFICDTKAVRFLDFTEPGQGGI